MFEDERFRFFLYVFFSFVKKSKLLRVKLCGGYANNNQHVPKNVFIFYHDFFFESIFLNKIAELKNVCVYSVWIQRSDLLTYALKNLK